MTSPRLTVRARLTLLYTGLFALCGGIVVAVAYTLVARIPVASDSPVTASDTNLTQVLAQCQKERLDANPDKRILAKCDAVLTRQGALNQRDLTLSHLLRNSLVTLAVVIALATILGWIAAGRALRPIRRVTATARAATQLDLSTRVALGGPRDELRDLADTFDDMLDRLQAAFEAQRQFIANASHELRTPLTVMRTTVDVVANNPDSTPDDLRAMATDVRDAVDHTERLIGALLILARHDRGLTSNDRIDLATIAEDILDTIDHGDLHLHAVLEPAVITGDTTLIERLVANLIDNATRYNTPGGHIWITTRTTAGHSQLTVANTGAVISPTDTERIFEPFQRLNDRTSHDGFGLGLTIVSSIARLHGGTAVAEARQAGGLDVIITIPSTGLGLPPVR